MALKGFLFDLDQTLVDSSALAGLRTMGMWSQVAAQMHTIRAFAGPPPPHEIPGRLRAAGFRIGIVTSSPRSYAEEVIRTFAIQTDVLVAYHDTTNHKPDPEPIQAGLTALGLQAAEVCHVGDDAKDHVASYRAGVRSIGAGWSGNTLAWSSSCPDLVAMNTMTLLDPGFVEAGGYLTETLAAGRQPLPHDGWVIPCDGTTIALGRYFTKRARRGRVLSPRLHPARLDRHAHDRSQERRRIVGRTHCHSPQGRGPRALAQGQRAPLGVSRRMVAGRCRCPCTRGSRDPEDGVAREGVRVRHAIRADRRAAERVAKLKSRAARRPEGRAQHRRARCAPRGSTSATTSTSAITAPAMITGTPPDPRAGQRGRWWRLAEPNCSSPAGPAPRGRARARCAVRRGDDLEPVIAVAVDPTVAIAARRPAGRSRRPGRAGRAKLLGAVQQGPAHASLRSRRR